MKQLTIIEYLREFQVGLSRQGVLYRINNNLALPYVVKIEKIGKSYVLTVNPQT